VTLDFSSAPHAVAPSEPNMPTDPILRLRDSFERLDPGLCLDLLALGSALVPRLIALLDDGQAGWGRVHAVDLLVDLRATEAVRPMLSLMGRNDYDDPDGEQAKIDEVLDGLIYRRLAELGPAVLESALTYVAENVDNEGAVFDACHVLVHLGIKDPRIFDAVQRAFEFDAVLGAGLFATYGDPRGVGVIESTLSKLAPSPSSVADHILVGDLLLAYGQLGGVLPADVQARVDGWLARWDRRRAFADERPN
jgi:hypothetical protein